MVKKILYKTVVKVTVLSDEPIGDADMETILRQTDNGGWVGSNKTITQDQPIKGIKAVRAMEAIGSHVEFFQMDEKGNELQD